MMNVTPDCCIELLFQQVPLLRIDGMDLVQSGAIARYLARKTHVYADTDEQAAKYASPCHQSCRGPVAYYAYTTTNSRPTTTTQ